MTQPDAPDWFTSSHSANNGACVECARLSEVMVVRDSTHRLGPTLQVPHDIWMEFTRAIKRSHYQIGYR